MTAPLHHTASLDDGATDDVLRSLDPAGNVGPEVVGNSKAVDTLARILATDPAEPAGPAAPPVRTGWARVPRRRWVLAGAALVMASALVVAPALTHKETAFATWSAEATAATPSETAAGGEECRRQWGGPEGIGPGSDGKIVAAAKASLVESRGAWTFVLLLSGGDFEATCLYNRHPASDQGFSGGGGTIKYDTPVARALAPNAIEVHSEGTTGDDNSSYAETTGRVGAEVASVVVNTPHQGAVKATVHEGYFVAWWPGPGIPRMNMDPKAEALPEPESPTYTVILKDGSVRADLPVKQIWSTRK